MKEKGIIKSLVEIIKAENFIDFEKNWIEVKGELSEIEKQKLLTTILDEYYVYSSFSQFKRVFDLIIDSKVNLNFNIDHWAPTFLSLVVLRSPSKQLFDYFIKKGALINFIGDTLAFEPLDEIKDNIEPRYSTCLDFAIMKEGDLLYLDYNSAPPKHKVYDLASRTEKETKVVIDKTELEDLLRQSHYLHDLVMTSRLVLHIKKFGGKTFKELKTINN